MGGKVRLGWICRAEIPLNTHHSAYLLASAALSPFYGKISDLVGRKLVLFPVIIIFLVCRICGANDRCSRAYERHVTRSALHYVVPRKA